ncbi:olfactory receptor 11A1-like [Pleurodeles waltl]|uniref:olfactory receptor 11A1-like n=1 Tax=Pleurodeles waltl TaxID=8319 RepID=UPI0037096FC3
MVQRAEYICFENTTNVPGFILLGFQILPELKPFLFVIFLLIYLLTVVGNILILVTVSANNNLHSPMYFFLGNLSFLEIWYTTNIVHTMLGGFLSGSITLSLAGCVIQLNIFGSLAITECFLLTLMAYDRYMAICYPLHYSTLMSQRVCVILVQCTWASGFLIAMITSILIYQLQFPARNWIDHFFCDNMPLLKSACSDIYLAEMYCIVVSFTVTPIPFLLIIVSYMYIIVAIMRIPSATGRQKAFSTCSSHLLVVAMYFGTLIALYVAPSTGHSMNINKALSLLYTVATPMLNPIIYTLRNKDIRGALKITFQIICSRHRDSPTQLVFCHRKTTF